MLAERPIRTYLRATKPVEQQLKLIMAKRAAELRGALRGVDKSTARNRIMRRHIKYLYRDVASVIYWGEQEAAEAAARSMSKHHATSSSNRAHEKAKIFTGREKNLDRLLGLLDKNERAVMDWRNRDVADLMNPMRPGGISYQIMRIARSEMNKAFHDTSVKVADEASWFEWRLSSTHPTLDVCNEYAAHGRYGVHDVPDKPHPFCLCYVVPVVR